MSKHLISLAVFAALGLSGCAAATQYDTGAVVLDVFDAEAFNSRLETTESFLDAYDAMKVEDYARAEALLDQALAQKPKDPYALLAMGSVHERTGRFASAAEYYRGAEYYGNAAAGPRLQSGKELPLDNTLTVAEVARENLDRMSR